MLLLMVVGEERVGVYMNIYECEVFTHTGGFGWCGDGDVRGERVKRGKGKGGKWERKALKNGVLTN